MIEHEDPAPFGPPSGAELRERDHFQAITRSSLTDARVAARAWRNGLAAFVTLTTTVLLAKGEDQIAKLATPWRAAVVALTFGGVALATTGLWNALAAEAGFGDAALSLPEIRRDYGSLDAYLLTLSLSASKRLIVSRALVGLSIIALLAGQALSWIAPTTPPTNLYQVQSTNSTTCGNLLGLDDRQMYQFQEEHSTVTNLLPASEVRTIRLVSECGPP